MEESGNKTVMCSVLFMDVVEYSRRSVTEQIALKDRFNTYLADAIGTIPVADRIILDTGDGAAVNFLGDVGDALKVGLALMEHLQREDAGAALPLRVRMGINLGPVRIVRDINGQPNIVGDGINVAQRIMGFAEPGQILISRSYHDAVTHLSPVYVSLFRYEGSRTDKHVREHEIYSLGEAAGKDVGVIEGPRLVLFWQKLTDWERGLTTAHRIGYAAALFVLLLLVMVAFKGARNPEAKMAPVAEPVPPAATSTMPEAGPAPVSAGSAIEKPQAQAVRQEAAVQRAVPPVAPSRSAESTRTKKADNAAHIVIVCRKDEAQVFIDFIQRGKVSYGTLELNVAPREHRIVVKHASGIIHRQRIDPVAGETIRINPDFCN